MDKVILAQQFNNLLIGLGGAFLAMMAIVTAIHVKETGPGAEMKNFARRDFLAASSSLVVCALVGVVCMSMISAGSSIAPLKDDAAFHVACSFLFLCTFGLLECLNTLGLLLLVGDEDETIIEGASKTPIMKRIPRLRVLIRKLAFSAFRFFSGRAKLTRLNPFQRGQFIFGAVLRFFLILSCLFSLGSAHLYAQDHRSEVPFWPQLVYIGPFLLASYAAWETFRRRRKLGNMEVSPIPPTVSVKSVATCLLLALFFQGWFGLATPGWVTIMLNLTLVLFAAVSTHFTMNRPILHVRVLAKGAKKEWG